MSGNKKERKEQNSSKKNDRNKPKEKKIWPKEQNYKKCTSRFLGLLF